jgi:hypothetical protein
MVGGSEDDVAKLQPVFDALKPAEAGFVHAGPVGAGHFAKMVHNGIEYAMMQAYAEGYELLAATDVVRDVPGVVKSWTAGTVIRSWLLDLLVRALEEDDDLSELRGYAEDSGEGRWTVEAAIENAVPMPAISAALFARFTSRQDDSPAMKVIAALRNQFGGHAVTAGHTSGPPTSPSRVTHPRPRRPTHPCPSSRPPEQFARAMHLTRLGLVDFRSYAAVDLALEPGVTTFVGPNGQGKTNLVEAVGYLATLGSHRVAADAPLVRQGAERAVVARAGGAGRAHHAARGRDRPGVGRTGRVSIGAGAAAARGARPGADRALRTGGPGAGQGRPQ